ncbi:MAG: hypothetical protein M1812_005297 [Candelaria pacifica]|nr:MAG: hypothetical protein M1812_005297 [Candelaria pacifica]
MTTLSPIERLPSEILDAIADHLIKPSDIKSFRTCSRRLSRFGGLFKTLHLFTTMDSLKIMTLVSQHPSFRKEVCSIICWLPLFESRIIDFEDYKRNVHRQMVYRDAFEAPTLAHLLAIQNTEFFSDAEYKKGYANYTRYSQEQGVILQTDLIDTLKVALPQLPRLETVSIRSLPEYMLVFSAMAASRVKLHTLAFKSYLLVAHRIAEVEIMKEVFHSIRHLKVELKDQYFNSIQQTELDADKFARMLQLTPNLQNLKLKLEILTHEHYTTHKLLGAMTWPYLKRLSLKDSSVREADILDFLSRHLGTLRSLKLESFYITDGTFKPLLELLSTAPKPKLVVEIVGRCGGMHGLTERLGTFWGAEAADDKGWDIRNFIYNDGPWTNKLERICNHGE